MTRVSRASSALSGHAGTGEVAPSGAADIHGGGAGVGAVEGQRGDGGRVPCTGGPQLKVGAAAGGLTSRTSVLTVDGVTGRSGKTGRESVTGGPAENVRAVGAA